jgi:hypothetical protein
MTRSVVLEGAVFETALEDSLPQMEALMSATEKGVRGYLVALPPLAPEPKYMDSAVFDQMVDEVAFQYDFGGCSDEHPYHRVGPAKLFGCYIYRERGYSSRYIRDHPWLLGVGMSKWAGGINDEGILVAYSGQSEDLDELIAKIFSSAVKSICRTLFRDCFDALPGVLVSPLSRAL